MFNFKLCLIACVLLVAKASPLLADEVEADTKTQSVLEVIDAYAEMHTGPGRGYPVFHVVENGESIHIMTRRPDWYEVLTANGKVGWVTASQIARTLQKTGEPVDLPTVSFGDYLKNRWRVGAAFGTFASGELKGADTFSANLGYKPVSWMGGELEVGKFYGVDVSGSITSFNLIVEPYSRWRFSPVVVLGGGLLNVDVQPKLVPLDIEQEKFFNYGLRLNYYLGRNFVVRGEYRRISLSSGQSNGDSSTWNLGFSTFY